jgi:sulfite exporter TauE/SafE
MPTPPELLSLTLLGLLGTGHCVGMCGPLVISLPGRLGIPSAHLWYHLGRITTYTLIGALLGGLGGALGRLGLVAQVQISFAALAALFLLLFGLERIDLLRAPGNTALLPPPQKLPGYRTARRAVASGRPVGMLPMGAIMGFLPCGLSYAAFARALPAGGLLPGALLVLAFALGTLPGLLLLGTAASRLMQRHRALSETLSGVLMIAMGIKLAADIIQALL